VRASFLRKGEDWDGGPPPHSIPAKAETAISCGRWPVRSRARQVDFSWLAHPASLAPAPTRGPPPSRCRKVAAGGAHTATLNAPNSRSFSRANQLGHTFAP